MTSLTSLVGNEIRMIWCFQVVKYDRSDICVRSPDGRETKMATINYMGVGLVEVAAHQLARSKAYLASFLVHFQFYFNI